MEGLNSPRPAADREERTTFVERLEFWKSFLGAGGSVTRCRQNWAIGTIVPLLLSVIALCPSHANAQDYVPGEVLVKLKSRPGSTGSNNFMGKTAAMKGMTLRRSWAGLNMHKFSLKGQAGAAAVPDVMALVQELRKDPEVAYAEPNYYVRAQSTGFESRAFSSDEVRQMAATGPSAYSTQPQIQSQQAWSIVSADAAPVVVAIIDTGLDWRHSVFADSGALWTNSYEVSGNGIDDDGNGYVDDIHGWNFVDNNPSPLDDEGHGTHVAGIVLGVTMDIHAEPISAAKIRLMPLKFLDSSGAGNTSDAIEAIYYAANNGATILNNSWGGGGYSQALVDAVEYSYNKKTIFVAAAGNAANNNDASPTYPANYSMPNLISVAATTDADMLASFSNFGARTVHMGSPGVSILSTTPNNTFSLSSGTSMATPFVSGVAALMKREKPDMNGYQIKQLIFYGNDGVGGLSGKVATQSRLNVYNAVLRAQETAVDPNMPAYDPSTNGVSRAPASASMAPAGCGLVKSILDSRGGGGPDDPFRNVAFFGLLVLLMAPVLLGLHLRRASTGKSRRQYERFQIASQVRIKLGDRELLGNVSSISLGGAQVNTDAWLEHGGVVSMQISSPDGKDVINVQGKVVWCEEQKRYGVAFQNAEENAIAAISRWTQSLLKTG
jgi:subtilisin family serine protease